MLIRCTQRVSHQFYRQNLKYLKRNVSALYVTGDKAKENFVALVPYFDFHGKLQNQQNLIENICRRQLNINVPQLYELWELYKDILQKRQQLEKRRVQVSDEIRKIMSGNDENLKRKFQTEGIRIREDLKILKENLYPLESKFINEFLDLPNEIHRDTPISLDNIQPIVNHMQPHLATNDFETKSHLKFTDLIDYRNPYNYYLLKDAAQFDAFLPFYILNEFREKGFIHFSNPDFLKTVAVEGCAYTPNDVYKIVDDSPENRLNMLHLVGNGSMLSYLGYISKLSILKNQMPLKLISSGKCYTIPKSKTELGLYSVSQSTQVQLFIATADNEANDIFDDALQQMIHVYQSFDEHFRVILAPANKLNKAESIRADFEMYSPHLKEYVCVGNLCYYGDFISKRLLCNYKDDDRTIHFPHLISGTVVDVAKLLVIWLENKNNVKLPFSML